MWHFFSSIPGRGADTYQVIARTTMVEQHIHDSGWLNTLRWQKDANFWGILPFIGYTEAFLGQIAGYNLWWFFSFFLAFLGMWLFVKDITGSNWGALASAFIFAFSPFHFSQAVATNIGTMHYEWLAWLAFFLHRFMKSTSWRSAAGVAVSILLIIATEHQLLAFTIMLLVFFFPFLIFLYPENLKKWRFWVTIIIGLVVLFSAGAAQFDKIWQIAHSENNYLKPPYSQVEDYSADGVDFLIPARFQTFWGEKFNYLRENTASNPEGRQSFYLGFIAIILAILGIIKIFRQKSKNKAEFYWATFWLAISVFFLILSLGPTLHFAGKTYLVKKLPYILLYNFVPYWNYIRTTSRIFVVVTIGWAFLAGIGAKYFEEFLRSKEKSKLTTLAAAIVILGLPLEYFSVPVPSLDLGYSAFYDKLAENKDAFSILEIPGSTSYDFGSYSLYTQRIHQKNKIDGIDFARSEEDRWTFQRNTPIIEALLYSLPTGGNDYENSSGGDIVISDYTPFGSSILNFYHIRYVTLSKVNTGNKKFNDQEFQNTVNYLEQKLGLAAYYEDNFLKAYSVPQNSQKGYFLALDTGSNDSWGQKEGTGKSKGRSARDGAKMRVVNLESTPINLQVNFKGSIKYLRYVDISLDGNVVKTIFLKEFKGDYSFSLDQLSPGEHALEFKISDENHQPINDFSQDRSVKFSQFETVGK